MTIKETEKHLKGLLKNAETTLIEYSSSFDHNDNFVKDVKKFNIAESFLLEIKTKSLTVLDSIRNLLNEKTGELFFKELRLFLLQNYGPFVDLLKMLFLQIAFYLKNKNMINLMETDNSLAFNLLGGNYLLLTTNYKSLRTDLNQFFFKDITLKDELVVDDKTQLWNVGNMHHKLFPSDFYQIRDFAFSLTAPARGKISNDDMIILEEQVSELIKNAIKHGNKNDINKIVKTWTLFTGEMYKIIVEDEGQGFQNLEKWNDFNRKRNAAILNKDIDAIMKYVSYDSAREDDSNGGNALFSALEFWDSGLIYSAKKNKVLAVKYFF